MSAPAAARARATARPWPCAAPVMKATLPDRSDGAVIAGLAVVVEHLVQRHASDRVDEVRRHHLAGERDEDEAQLRVERLLELGVHRVGDLTGRASDEAAPVHEQLL